MPRPAFHHLLAALFAGVLSLLITGSARAQLTETQRADFEVWKAVLVSTSGEPGVQRTAARRLLDSGWDESLQVLGEAIGDFSRPALVSIVCGAIRDMDSPPDQLFDVLIDRLCVAPSALIPDLADAIGAYPPSVLPRLIERLNHQKGEASEKIALITALSRFTEIEVVDQLINCLEPSVEPAVRSAALDALVDVTGADHGDSMTRWQAWWRNNRLQGRDGLIRRKIRRLERERNEAIVRIQTLQRDVAALTSDLLTAVNRNYTLTDPEQRNVLLLSLLQNPRTAVRRLGLDLVEQRVLNAEPLSSEVVATLAKLVSDPAPSLRPLAVRRYALVDAAQAARLVGPMLAETSDAEMESAILSVLGQTASADAVPALVDRFTRAERPKGASAALLTATLAGFVPTESLSVIASRLSEQGAANLSVADAELLAWCPDPSAGAVLLGVLQSSEVSADRKTAAARGLVASGLHQDALLATAADPIVYPHALKAAAKRGGLEALELMLGWSVVDAARLGEEVSNVLLALPPAQWLEADTLVAAHEAVDLQRRVNSLARVLTLPQPNNSSAGGEGVLSPSLRRQTCLRLAELHWRRADPEAMLTAVQAAPPGEGETQSELRWRNIALVAMERFDAANAERGADWVDALDLVLRQRTADLDRAARIAEVIKSDRVTGLSDADRSRLDALVSKLAALTPEPGAGG